MLHNIISRVLHKHIWIQKQHYQILYYKTNIRLVHTEQKRKSLAELFRSDFTIKLVSL